MIFRLVFLCLVSFLMLSCAQEVAIDDNPDCISISGESPGGSIANFGYVVSVKSGFLPSEIADEYAAEYGGAFDWFEADLSSFKANINSNAAVDELRCDTRIKGIAYDSIPEGNNGP